jgi:TorA maturation chaperone TorD
MQDEARSAAERGNLYGLLATVFRRPLCGEQLRRFRAAPLMSALAEAGLDPGPRFATQAEADLLDELAVDYTQLFHGPRDHIAAYESIQTGPEDAPLNGAAADRVRDVYASAGFTVNREAGELPDHIGVELAFMAELAGEEALARQAGDGAAANKLRRVQRDFMEVHLGRWAADFADQVRARATTAFYREFARLLGGFLETERTMLGRERNAAGQAGVGEGSRRPVRRATCGA